MRILPKAERALASAHDIAKMALCFLRRGIFCMDLLVLFVKGLFAGLAIAAPVGPVGMLCVRRALAYGRMAGFLAGLGAAFADMLFGLVAAFGLTLVSDWLFDHQTTLRLGGGTFLIILGLRMILRPVPNGAVTSVGVAVPSAWRGFFSAFFLTVTNPITIAAFFGVFAAIGVDRALENHFAAWVLVAGVFGGSVLWWLILVAGAERLRPYLMAGDLLHWVHRGTGWMMLTFAAYAFISLL